jgi:C-terminal processing protease CtpA/Prc
MRKTASRCFLSFLALAGSLATPAYPQQISGADRDRAQTMLQDISNDIRRHYYDPKYNGVDWEARVQEAAKQIDQSPSLNMALSHLAAALDSLNDSHVFLLPPQRSYRIDFGYQTQMVGDNCYIIRVRPGSDAETKGLKSGDKVLEINGYAPTRDTLWKMDYVYRHLRPQQQMILKLRHPDGQLTEVTIENRLKQLKKVDDLTGGDGAIDIWNMIRQDQNEGHLMRARHVEVSNELMILKVPEFSFSPSEVADMIDKARKVEVLIVDLRGNPGGSTETLENFLSGVFDHETKIGDVIGRDNKKPWVAKPKGHSVFSGKVVVLVDSASASASELFARVIQIEKRGVVLGDQTSGSVMRARRYSYKVGLDTVVYFGASITDANIVMTDGKSLEHTGVTPDELILPTADDLATGRDAVIVRAAEIAGVKLTAEAAGKLFPYEWSND